MEKFTHFLAIIFLLYFLLKKSTFLLCQNNCNGLWVSLSDSSPLLCSTTMVNLYMSQSYPVKMWARPRHCSAQRLPSHQNVNHDLDRGGWVWSLSPGPSLACPPLTFPSTQLVPANLASLFFLQLASPMLLPGLWTCDSLCLEVSSPKYPSQYFTTSAFIERFPSRGGFTATLSYTFPVPFPWFIFLVSSLLFILLIFAVAYCPFSPCECHLQGNRSFCVFCSGPCPQVEEQWLTSSRIHRYSVLW